MKKTIKAKVLAIKEYLVNEYEWGSHTEISILYETEDKNKGIVKVNATDSVFAYAIHTQVGDEIEFSRSEKFVISFTNFTQEISTEK